MQERLSIIYVGDSEADEFAIRMLKGVAFTFRVTNEDSEAITKTSADYWIAGEEGLHIIFDGRMRVPFLLVLSCI